MVMSEDKVGKLEEAALKRKERLEALKRKRRGGELTEKSSTNEDELPTPQVLFRNYQPESEALNDGVLPQVEPAKVEELIEDQLKHSDTSKPIADVEINNLAPKKLTYDLRRGIQAQLDRLEKRTDKAIAELIRERLKEGRQQDFLIAVNAGAKMQQKRAFDSDDDE